MSAADDFLNGGQPTPAAPAAAIPAAAPAPSAQASAPPAAPPVSADAFLTAPPKAKKTAEHDPSILQHVEAWSQNALESPVGRGLNAVLNATSNFGVGTADALAKGHGWNSFAEGINAVSHPGQASNTTHDLETRMHLYNAGKNAPWWGRVFETAQDFAVQTALDPAMWIPGLDVASIVGKALKVGKAITGTEKAVTTTEHIAAEVPNLTRFQAKAGEPSAHPNRGGEFYSTDSTLGEQGYKGGEVSPNANPGRKGEAVLPMEGGPNRVDRIQDAKNPLVVKASQESGWPGVLKSRGLEHLAGKVTSSADLYQALKDSGVPLKDVANMKKYGDTSMAMDRLLADHAKSLGHDAVQLPGGEYFSLDKNAVREAKPAQDITHTSLTGLTPIGKALKAVAGTAPGRAIGGAREEINKYFNADHFLDKLMTPAGKDVLKGQQAGHAYAYKNLGDDAKADVERGILNKEADPAAMAKRFMQDHADKLKPGVTEGQLASHLAVVKGQEALSRAVSKEEPNLLQKFSRYGRDTLFLLPFAHMKNLSIMALLGPGGAKTLAKGGTYMKRLHEGDAATLAKVENMKKLGIAADYGSGVDKAAGAAAETSMYSKVPGLNKLAATSTKALTDYDTAMRLALYDHLKAKGMDEYTIGGHIRSTMGDYGNQSKFIENMRTVGANFPAWRAGIVPRAMLKAVKEQPKNVKMYAQASGDIENDKPFPGQNGAGFTAGSVPEDFSEMASPPAGTLAYGTSGSTVGPIATAEQMKGQAARGDLKGFAEQQAENFLPFGSVLSKIPALNKFSGNTQANPLLQAAGGLVGARFPDAPAFKKRKARLTALGMPPAEIYKQLRAEGLIADSSPLGK